MTVRPWSVLSISNRPFPASAPAVYSRPSRAVKRAVCFFQGGKSMPRQPRAFIGVNADLVPAGKQSVSMIRLPLAYMDAIVAAGGLPVVVPPCCRDVEADAYLDRLDGFLLIGGGGDLDPRRHGLPSHAAV